MTKNRNHRRYRFPPGTFRKSDPRGALNGAVKGILIILILWLIL